MSIISKKKEVIIEKPDTPRVAVSNSINYDEELKPTVESYITKGPTGEYNLQLVSAGNVFSGVSLEDALQKGFGSTATYYNYYKATGTLRKCINLTASLTTRAGFETTISCVDKKDDPTKPEYLEVKRKIDELNRRVNMDNTLYITQIKRYLYGKAAWEITLDTRAKQIMRLDPLKSAYAVPIVSENGTFEGVEYYPSEQKIIPKNRLLYFTLDALENDKDSLNGLAIVTSIERNIKIKKNLERDLLYAARSLWAPIVIYEADTRGLTPTEKEALFTDLQSDLKPGAVVITNRAVKPIVVQYNPDLNNLIRAIEKQDEEIIGTFGIPKALLSREKTIARATLEFSLRAFYESTIAGDQAYLKRQIESQWYDPLVKLLGYSDKINIRHEWRPILDPQSDLLTALVRAFEAGVVNAEEFYRRLGWELDRAEPVKEEESEKNE